MQLLAIILLSLTLCAAAYTPPVGIPDPGDEWGSVHPIDAEPPAHPDEWPEAEATNYYYIDPDHGSATDSANTYGYPNKPRVSFPEVTYSAGAYIEVHNGYQTGGGQLIATFSGTAENPCWVVGTGTGGIGGEWIIKGSYLIVDGMLGNGSGTIGIRPHSASNAHHICIRNCTFVGAGTVGSGSVITAYGESGNRFSDIVVYGNSVSNYGDDDPASAENDYHGLSSGSLLDRAWWLSNTVFNVGGDSIQIGAATITPDSLRGDYVYVGGNHFYDNRENAVDIKESNYVVVSQNICHGFETTSSSAGEAILAHNNATSVWCVANTCYDCEIGIITTGSTPTWFVGNVVYGTSGDALHFRGTTSGGAVDNTIYNCASGVNLNQGTVSYSISGNIFDGTTGDDITTASSGISAVTTVDRNLYSSASYDWHGNAYANLAAFQAATTHDDNSIEGASGLSNPTTSFTLSVGSSAIGANTEHAVYDAYFAVFGVSIERDRAGAARPQGGTWDIGAYEYTSGGGGTINATTLNITNLTVGP